MSPSAMRWLPLLFFLVALSGCIGPDRDAAMDPDCADIVQPLPPSGLLAGPPEAVLDRSAEAFQVTQPTEATETQRLDGGREWTVWDHPEGHVDVYHHGDRVDEVSFKLRGAHFGARDEITDRLQGTRDRFDLHEEGLETATSGMRNGMKAELMRRHDGQEIHTVLMVAVTDPSVVFGDEPMTRYDVREPPQWPCAPYPLVAAEEPARQSALDHMEAEGLPGPLESNPAGPDYQYLDRVLDIRVRWDYGKDTCDIDRGGRIQVHLDGFTGETRFVRHLSLCSD